MLFNSPLFLFVFLPITLLVYNSTRTRSRNTVLLTASLAFYAWAEPRFIGVALLSAFGDWLLAQRIDQSADERRRKAILTLAVCLNLAVLAYFKYLNFGVENLNVLLTAFHVQPVLLPAILLPVGVSFIVFEKITYVVDVYREVGTPEPSFASYLLYVFFFPKLLAGPIIKYHEIATQLHDRTFRFELRLNDAKEGMVRFSVGLAKKVILADTLGAVVEQTFALPAGKLGFHNAWWGLICFTLQIYFDFSGYSDMAIGLARMFGFRLAENFNVPYAATSFTDFWRRWHISLSTWIREYLYYPLGGNRVSTLRTYLNLWLCFFLSGLWHGANWTFVIWGIYHGCFLVADKLFWLRIQRKLPGIVSGGLTLLFIMASWAIFRSGSVAQMVYYLRALIPGLAPADTFLFVTRDVYFCVVVGACIAMLPGVRWWNELRGRFNMQFSYAPESALAGCLALLLLSICKISVGTFSPFLYFRF